MTGFLQVKWYITMHTKMSNECVETHIESLYAHFKKK